MAAMSVTSDVTVAGASGVVMLMICDMSYVINEVQNSIVKPCFLLCNRAENLYNYTNTETLIQPYATTLLLS